MYRLRESVGLNEGGFRILDMFKDSAMLVIDVVKHPVILIVLDDGLLTVQVDVPKDAATNCGDSGVVVDGNTSTIKLPAGTVSNKV